MIALIFLAAASASAITSAYTHLDFDRCTALKQDKEAPDFMSWRCRGYAGVPLFVQSDDDRYDVDAGRDDDQGGAAATFDYPGDTVEWRLSRGRPFAIIYRLNSANPDVPKSSRLIVETIARRGRPGCRIVSIDGALPNANALARRAADGVLRAPVRCLKQ